jgi:hypothetical protein
MEPDPGALDDAWRESFELAWEAFRARTIPVGAVTAEAPPFASTTCTPREAPLLLSGPLGDLGELLHVAHFLWRTPDGHVVASHRERSTGLIELAEVVDLMAAADAGATLDDAIRLVSSARA